MPRQDIYVSVDVETDGPIPGPNSMLSLGAAAFEPGNTKPVATFEINFSPLPGATPDPDTMRWWGEQDKAVWAHVTKDPVEPAEAVKRLVTWTKDLRGGTPVLVTYPSWDYMWVHWYCIRFAGKSPFGLGGLDMKSFAFGILTDITEFRETSKKRFPRRVFEGAPPHTHRGLDDAIGQGVQFINFLKMAKPGW